MLCIRSNNYLPRHYGDVSREFVQSGMHHLAFFRAPGLTAVNRSTRTTRPIFPPRMSSSRLWRRGRTSRRLRLWCDHSLLPGPRCLQRGVVNTLVEEDPLHNAERRSTIGTPHAHNTIRHAQQVENSEEADVPLLGGMPQTRRPGQAAAGVDIGLVRTTARLFGYCLILNQQCDSLRLAGAKRIREG